MSDNTAPDWGFETRMIHAGQLPDSATGARAVPIYQTTSYVFESAEHAQNLFALAEVGNIGGFNRSSQHLVMEVAGYGCWQASGGGSCDAGPDVVAGAALVVHSATKFIGGHGTSIGGVIVDGGSFDFGASGRHAMFTEPDPSYHGLAYWPALGPGAYILKARVQLLRDIGPAVSPMNAFLFLQGVETLSLRMERHVANAEAVASYLEAHPQVEWVQYAGLESSPYHQRAKRYMPRGAGSVLAFGIVGGSKEGQRFVESLDLHSHVANIGDVRSLAIHPASTTHSQLTPEEQSSTGTAPNMVRLSVGIETIDDIIADLEAGFAAVAGL